MIRQSGSKREDVFHMAHSFQNLHAEMAVEFASIWSQLTCTTANCDTIIGHRATAETTTTSPHLMLRYSDVLPHHVPRVGCVLRVAPIWSRRQEDLFLRIPEHTWRCGNRSLSLLTMHCCCYCYSSSYFGTKVTVPCAAF